MLIIKGLQGIGSAASITAAVRVSSFSDAKLFDCVLLFQIGILAQSFPPGLIRSRAFAIFSAGAPFGGAIGFVFGGLLTELTT